jgi:hypothetical protein
MHRWTSREWRETPVTWMSEPDSDVAINEKLTILSKALFESQPGQSTWPDPKNPKYRGMNQVRGFVSGQPGLIYRVH